MSDVELKVKTSELFRQTMPDDITRHLTVAAAYDFHNSPRGNFGIHGQDWFFTVSRGDAAVELRWMMPFWLKPNRKSGEAFSGGGNVFWHSPMRLHEYDQHSTNCKWTKGSCYSDGSSLLSRDIFENFVGDPSQFWQQLEKALIKLEQDVEKAMKDLANGP